jgi:putative ABC transport system permease protein
MANSIGQRRLSMVLLGLFASLALLLSAVGIYGVISHSVAQRRQEFGVRMALGAGKRDLLRLVAGQGVRLASAGLVLGLFGAYALTRVIRSQLFQVDATDPATFAQGAVLLVVVAMLATLLPALRAMHVSPTQALRQE